MTLGREESSQLKRITERASAIDSWGPRFRMQEQQQEQQQDPYIIDTSALTDGRDAGDRQ
ncbi:hypothetical protein ACMYSQ_001759 [Aspergillus niger]